MAAPREPGAAGRVAASADAEAGPRPRNPIRGRYVAHRPATTSRPPHRRALPGRRSHERCTPFLQRTFGHVHAVALPTLSSAQAPRRHPRWSGRRLNLTGSSDCNNRRAGLHSAVGQDPTTSRRSRTPCVSDECQDPLGDRDQRIRVCSGARVFRPLQPLPTPALRALPARRHLHGPADSRIHQDTVAHVLRDEPGRTTHALRDAFLIGRDDLAAGAQLLGIIRRRLAWFAWTGLLLTVLSGAAWLVLVAGSISDRSLTVVFLSSPDYSFRSCRRSRLGRSGSSSSSRFWLRASSAHSPGPARPSAPLGSRHRPSGCRRFASRRRGGVGRRIAAACAGARSGRRRCRIGSSRCER